MVNDQPTAFKWRHFHGEVIMQCVRWYCKYGISYRDLEEMMSERGLKIDHTTINRWVIQYAPLLEESFRKRHKRSVGGSWRMDESVPQKAA